MSKKIKTQSGESVIVDDDVYKALHHLKWYVRKCRESVTIVRPEYDVYKKNHNIIKYIIELKEGYVPDMTKGWYTMKNDNMFDCRYNNIKLRDQNPEQECRFKIAAAEKARWKKLSRKVNKSMACIIREKMNDECDKKGV